MRQNIHNIKLSSQKKNKNVDEEDEMNIYRFSIKAGETVEGKMQQEK